MNITVKEACEKFNFTVIAGADSLENKITNLYIGDLLSWVMGKAKEGCAWVTMQSHINIVAVAMLVNAACIIVSEGSQADPDTITKANDEDIPILATSATAYEVAEMFAYLKRNNQG